MGGFMRHAKLSRRHRVKIRRAWWKENIWRVTNRHFARIYGTRDDCIPRFGSVDLRTGIVKVGPPMPVYTARFRI